MKRFGLIGYPLTHSFSAKYFTDKFNREGLADHVYEHYSIQSIDEIKNVLETHSDLCGLNVTIPYKQAVIPFLDSYLDTLPPGIQACNCIRIRDGKMTGYNTDVTGFELSFSPLLKPHHQHALILGNGGATEAVKFVLNKLGISFEVVSRKLKKGSTLLYEDLDQQTMEKFTVIINTTPLGTYPAVESAPPIPYGFLNAGHYLFDLVYNPAKTLFLQRGEEQGAIIKNGYDMLVIQAEESWKIWRS